MAKRKVLKKRINYIVGELFAECLINGKNCADQANVNDVLADILNTQNEFISRISHTQPGNVKGYYKKLREDLNKEIQVVADELNK
jgi:hypothetical protein